MLITLRMPRSSAEQLNLRVAGADEEVLVTLPAVELAGRLTVVTGKPVSSEAVARYCASMSAAIAGCEALIEKYGLEGVADLLREPCARRGLWLPEECDAVVVWMRCVLAAYFQSPRAPDNPDPKDVRGWARLQTGEQLAALCQETFPEAYPLWIVHEEAIRSCQAPPASEERAEEACDFTEAPRPLGHRCP